jgi:hypothetical protein
VMSRGYGAMLLKKSAAGLDHLKCNVSKFSEATLCQPLESLPPVPAGTGTCGQPSPHAHEETAMVRNELSPKSNRSNHCSFKEPLDYRGVPSVINCWILCQYGRLFRGPSTNGMKK